MNKQFEENKKILLDELEKWSEQPMSDSVAKHLIFYHDAYKVLCKLEKPKEGYHEKSEKIVSPYAHKRQEEEMHYNPEHAETLSEKPCRLHLDREMALLWTRDMINADGTTGPHWSMEKVRQVMEQRGMLPGYDQLTFFAVLNSVHSDYFAVAAKYGVNKPEFYIDLAKSWIDDPDAVEDKAARYFAYIVKH